jgi:methylmalonyl-CoA mutase
MMSEFLFSEFEPISSKQWKQKIQVDLKGADYNDALVWKNTEGINVRPFYHQDEFENQFSPIPGHPKHWYIAQDVFIDDAAIANKLALDAIEKGAEAIIFTLEKEFETSVVFKNFPFEKITVYFNFKFLSETFILQLKQFLFLKKTSVFYNIDSIGNLARSGNWFHNLKQDREIIQHIIQSNPSDNILGIDCSLYQNAGANMVQQLAYAIAHANEYFNNFVSEINSDTSLNEFQMTFNLAVGSNYFFEIAKIRALRKLYAALASEFGVSETCHIIVRPSKRNKTIYDYNVNMLRTTTECMSAILGGADTICNIPYDALYQKSNEFGERISRNQLLILKNESSFETASNPADGTYYIENLTLELAEKALQLFKDIEANGGFLKQLKEGIIQRKIKESADKEQQLFKEGTLVLLGTNKHLNTDDLMKDDLELYPFVKTNVRKTLITPIIEKRLAEKVEQTRINNE